MKYHVGDWVEILSPEEILQTLDGEGAIGNMPFMPEMLNFAGKRLQVSASAHKACDTIDTWRNRAVEDSVHLGVRCDGSAHGGHLLAGTVWPTMEVMVIETPAYLRRTMDEATGLALPDLAA